VNVANSPEFLEKVKEGYMGFVNEALVDKKYFTKVEALEQFMDLYFFGRKMGIVPTHNTYVPVSNNIMPRPKFRDYDKEDMEGKDYTYRSKETPQIMTNVRGTPSTLKPQVFGPRPGKSIEEDLWARAYYETPETRRKSKWTKNRRLSHTKRFVHRAIQTPLRWRFSTMSKPQENSFKDHKAPQANISLWDVFANTLFNGKK
jgi:hypothetical protein